MFKLLKDKLTKKRQSELVKNSNLFDRDYYLSLNPDVASHKIDPIDHYINFGWQELRDPSATFHTEFYLKSNKDVEESGMNPLIHYILHGQKELRPTKQKMVLSPATNSNKSARKKAEGLSVDEVDMHGTKVKLTPSPVYDTQDYTLSAIPSAPCIVLSYENFQSKKKTQLDVGVHLHLHYLDLADEFLRFLSNIEFKYSLYISITNQSDVVAITQMFTEGLPNANVTVKSFENRGRDIASFVVGFAKELQEHEIVGHFHTKRSPHNIHKSDWRRQLLGNTLGSSSLVNHIMSIFNDSRNVGMLFPEYHYSLKGQISWGTNFEVSSKLAKKLSINIEPENLALFPAGSMFWARTKALKPLLDSGLGFQDFPSEDGQVDGTTAHAIERLFGEVVANSGFDMIQVKSDRPHNLTRYYPGQWPYIQDQDLSSQVNAYIKNKCKKNKTVIYTAMTGGYDDVVCHEFLDPEFDYVLFTDTEVDSKGFWDVRAIDYWHPEPVRMARRIKTNPHLYLSEYETAIWIDANVIIKGCIKEYIKAFKESKHLIGGIPHPIRHCVYKEAQTLLDFGRDNSGRVERQMEEYTSENYPVNNGLIETNFFITDLNHPESATCFSSWWSQIQQFSHRDQLGVNYALWKNKQEWFALMTEKLSLRDSQEFAYLGHANNSESDLSSLSSVKNRVRVPRTVPIQERTARPPVDVVVCVHNALNEVRDCLTSVVSSIGSTDRIIIVDDGSNHETKSYLKSFHSQYKDICVLNSHESTARGYCASANIGMSLVTNPFFLMLNSDTKITVSALNKLISVADTNHRIAVVGPLSNAASTQSIPEIKGTTSQTAVNLLPEQHSLDEINQLCVKWSHGSEMPSVPLVHGFCQLIRTSVAKELKGFDEQAFPNGYGEENDFCFRVGNAGYDLKIATSAFVYHKKSASYSDDIVRSQLMQQGSKTLKALHGVDRLTQSIQIMEGHPALIQIRKTANKYFYGSTQS